MDITKVLLDAQHRDNGVRSAAEADLKRLQELDLPSFLVGRRQARLLADHRKARAYRGVAGPPSPVAGQRGTKAGRVADKAAGGP